jgi:hypothetical protein
MSIASLQACFATAIAEVKSDLRPEGRPELMRNAVIAMREAGNRTSAAAPDRDRIREALILLRDQGPERALATHLRYVCWGLITPMPGGSLLASRHLFPPTLRRIDHMFANRQVPVNAWRGLLGGYLGTTPTLREEAVENWSSLRGFLSSSLPVLTGRAKASPSWLTLLNEHDCLFGDHPCDRYSADMLAGRQEAVTQLRDDLLIPDDSWFWNQLLLSQVRRAEGLGDAGFIATLDTLLPQVAPNRVIVNDALAILLTRYAAIRTEKAHEGLKTLSVAEWGSPNLYTQAKWQLVHPPVKRMVQVWLVRENLIDIFHLLREEKETDDRRLNFWLGYHRQMDFARLAFGRQVIGSRNRNVMDMLIRKKESYSRLGGSTSANNAIIMKIGEYFFVEFSQTGNAAYGYSENNAPFDVSRREIHIDDLKNKGKAIGNFPETHKDTLQWLWEEKFASRLADLGITPDSEIPASPEEVVAPPPAPLSQADWNQRLTLLQRQHGLKIDDRRDRNGNLWVLHLRSDGEIADRLKDLGFRHVAGKGWWRK